MHSSLVGSGSCRGNITHANMCTWLVVLPKEGCFVGASKLHMHSHKLVVEIFRRCGTAFGQHFRGRLRPFGAGHGGESTQQARSGIMSDGVTPHPMHPVAQHAVAYHAFRCFSSPLDVFSRKFDWCVPILRPLRLNRITSSCQRTRKCSNTHCLHTTYRSVGTALGATSHPPFWVRSNEKLFPTCILQINICCQKLIK